MGSQPGHRDEGSTAYVCHGTQPLRHTAFPNEQHLTHVCTLTYPPSKIQRASRQPTSQRLARLGCSSRGSGEPPLLTNHCSTTAVSWHRCHPADFKPIRCLPLQVRTEFARSIPLRDPAGPSAHGSSLRGRTGSAPRHPATGGGIARPDRRQRAAAGSGGAGPAGRIRNGSGPPSSRPDGSGTAALKSRTAFKKLLSDFCREENSCHRQTRVTREIWV